MLKRIFDLFVALAALAVTSPLFLIAAIFVKATSQGPLFYRALRVGRHGVLFQMFKFRSMVEASGNTQAKITRAGDPRVTPVGRLLRRTKIDELPQLINVLRGEMSLVGPRPEDPKYVELYSEDEREVLTVRPGVTSPASLAFRDEESLLVGDDWEQQYRTHVLPEKLRIDRAYLRRRTFLSDLAVLLKTVLSILR